MANGAVVKSQQFTLDGNWQYFQTSYTPAAAVTTAHLRLNVGAAVGEYLIDNVFVGERAAYSRGGNIHGPFQGVCCSPADSIWPTEADFQWYQSHGFNILRLPMLWEELQPTLPADPKTGTPVFEETYIAKFEATLDLAYKYDIKVAPTFVNQGVRPMKKPNPAEAGLTWPDDYVFGTTKTPIEAYSKMWAALVTHIKATSTRYSSIWAWDLVNEPYRDWDWISTHQPAVISAIRAADGSAGKPVIAMPVDEWTYGYPHDEMKPIKRS